MTSENECGFNLNLTPLADDATATLQLDGESVSVSIKALWDASGEPKADIGDSNYLEQLKPFYEKVVGKTLSLWSTEILYNAVSNWVMNLYKKK
jgi:hypothetical protein